jgi:hypothetical protein
MMNDTGDPYVSALRHLTEKYGPERVLLLIDKADSAETEWHFAIQSRNPHAAPISGHVHASGLMLLNAGFTSLEILAERCYGDAKHVADFLEICEAVLEGKFEEVVISSGEHTLHTSGTFHLKPRPFISSRTQLSWRWLSSKSRRVHRYEPYT